VSSLFIKNIVRKKVLIAIQNPYETFLKNVILAQVLHAASLSSKIGQK